MAYQNLYAGAIQLRDNYRSKYDEIKRNQKEIRKALNEINELQNYYEYWKDLTDTTKELYADELSKLSKAKEMLMTAYNAFEVDATELDRKLETIQHSIDAMNLLTEEEERLSAAQTKARVEVRLKEIHAPKDYLSKYGLRG